MGRTLLNEKDIKDIIYGATLMGGGGGGSMSAGINMLENYKSSGKKIEVEMIDVTDMEDQTYAAVTAGMGAPTKIPDDFTPWLKEAFDLYVNMAAYRGHEVKYSMAVELGGFNTFVPMLVSMEKNIPFLNVDGAARAVPALTTLLFNVNGYDTFPLALSGHLMKDPDFNYVTYDFMGPLAKDAALGENLARSVLSTTMDQICGLSGWLTSKETLKNTGGLPLGSIDQSQKIGNILRNAPADQVFPKIIEEKIKAVDLGSYAVIDGKSDMASGFDKGWVVFELKAQNSKSPKFAKIEFQNENLVIYEGETLASLTPKMTAPDIICAFEVTPDGNVPLTNADFFDREDKIKLLSEVRLGKIAVDKAWWQRPISELNEIWGEYFKNAGYTGSIIPFDQNIS